MRLALTAGTRDRERVPHPATLLDDFGRHLALQRGLSEHTVRGYLSDVRSLLDTLREDDGAVDLTRLDLTALRAWLAGQARDGRSRSTLARRAAAARTFCSWAVRQGHLAEDVGVRLQSPRADKRVPQVLAVDEATVLLDLAAQVADDGDPLRLRDWAVLEMLYATGVRVAELVGIDVAAVDRRERTVRVLGKGGAERVVPFGVPADRALGEWLERGRPQLVTPTSPPALFLGARGGRLGVRAVRERVHDLTALAGVRDMAPTACGTCRHPPPRRWLGPAHCPGGARPCLLATTQRYTHVTPERLRAAYTQAHPAPDPAPSSPTAHCYRRQLTCSRRQLTCYR